MANSANLAIPKLTAFTSTWHSAPYDAISHARPELSMAGKSVVISGGGTGIGKAIALAFAQAGASSVAIVGRRERVLRDAIADITRLVRSGTCRLFFAVADLTQREQAEAAMASLARQQPDGRLNVLVCNAGDLAPIEAALDSDPNAWMQAFDFNVRMPLNTLQAFAPHAAIAPTVIHVSSGIAHMAPVPGLSAHGASKAAAVKLLDYIAVEQDGWRVVHLQPGSVDTAMSRKAGSPGKDDPALAGQICVWLASSEAAFLAGMFVWANWDVNELKARQGEIEASRVLRIGLKGVPM